MSTQAIAGQAAAFGFDRTEEEIAERNLHLLAQQQRSRRGPTPEVLFVKRLDNTRLVKADDPVRVREMRVFTAALTALFLFLMAYGWQHFSAIEYGYRVEAEKQQRDLLEEQNRHLRLDQAQLCDPGRIDKMARQLGLEAPQPGQVVASNSSSDRNGPALAEATPMLQGKR